MAIKSFMNPSDLYSLKDSLEAVNIIQTIPQQLFSEGYSYVSFDVVSLFTNMPLDKTIRIILNRVYEEKVLVTTLKKRTMKKLIRDCCSKTTFSFNNILYEQIDGVSMGSPLAPILANIIMTEFEKIVVNELLEKGIIKNYMRYVDDTLMLIKPNDIPIVLEKLNSFHKNLQFTVDCFEKEDVHFLDLKIEGNKTDVYYKETHTGQYTDFYSQTPWYFRTAWVKSLINRTRKICSDDNKL